MKNVILVGLVALGLTACGGAPDAEVAADKEAENAAVAAPAAEAEVSADAATPAEGVSATVEAAAAQ